MRSQARQPRYGVQAEADQPTAPPAPEAKSYAPTGNPTAEEAQQAEAYAGQENAKDTAEGVSNGGDGDVNA